MKLRDVALYSGLIGLPLAFFLLPRASPQPIPQTATIFMHIRHSPPYPVTLGKVRQIYSTIQSANKTGLNIGFEPQVLYTDWATQLAYYTEIGDIPVMLNVFTSDDALQLTTDQISQIMAVCNVKYLRFHEALSYFQPNYTGQPFPTDYARSILAFAKTNGIPVFWNEWDVRFWDATDLTQYPKIQTVIAGYEDNVAVSFGTNNNWLEPAQGYQLLQQFQRKGASVQSWYWWERNGRQTGYELTMPPYLMRQHTQEAFSAGCEVVQYEPYAYFFTNENPKASLSAVLNGLYV